MRAVILAAGNGDRLHPLTATLPKPLIPLAGRPIVHYTIDGLARAGVTDAVVVVGFREEQVRAALRGLDRRVTLSFASNSRYEGGASLSLRAARPYAGSEPFLLVMADHVLSGPIIGTLLDAHAARPELSHVAADFTRRAPAYTREATKLALSAGGRVTAIGKQIPSWQALDAGAFVLAPSVWDAMDTVPEDCELSVILTKLARRGELVAADITGAFWYDIDTAEDLDVAESLLPVGGR